MTHPTKPTVPATKSDREMFREWHEKQFGGEPTPSSTLCSREWEAWTAATAAQSEKLRIAVEALERITEGKGCRECGQNICANDIAEAALAKLKDSHDR